MVNNEILFRDRYLEALGLNPILPRDRERIKAALNRAHDIRKFEIELYWKRAAYFWGFQAVAFAALALLFKDGKLADATYIVLPASLGTVTALAAWFTARGSKFWQENWEAHVELLEGAIEGRLTQVIVSRRPPQFSVSRVNECLIEVLFWGWLMILIDWAALLLLSLFPTQDPLVTWKGWPFFVIPAVTVAAGVIGFRLWDTQTRITGRQFVEGDTDWKEYPGDNGTDPLQIIWRDPVTGRVVR
jgi:hypothetical protein